MFEKIMVFQFTAYGCKTCQLKMISLCGWGGQAGHPIEIWGASPLQLFSFMGCTQRIKENQAKVGIQAWVKFCGSPVATEDFHLSMCKRLFAKWNSGKSWDMDVRQSILFCCCIKAYVASFSSNYLGADQPQLDRPDGNSDPEPIYDI